MTIRRLESHPMVKENQGHLAIARGPLVYALEACDLTSPVFSCSLPARAELKAERVESPVKGMMVIRGTGEAAPEGEWSGGLYRAAAPAQPVPLTAIPYFAWDNRAAGAMRVWLPLLPPSPPVGTPERRAQVTISFANSNCQPWGVNDGLEPRSSGEQPAALCHWWPHRGGEEWVQYTWSKPVRLGKSSVYWFDDTGRGACRLPVSWEIRYLEGTEWKPVAVSGEYSVAMDQWCQISFTPVTTTALRLVVRMQPAWAAGVHEWKVEEEEDDG
jgi:hypothetical protein